MQHAAHLSPRQKREKSSADGGFETVSPASPLYCDNAATASALSFIKQIKRSVLSPMRIDLPAQNYPVCFKLAKSKSVFRNL